MVFYILLYFLFPVYLSTISHSRSPRARKRSVSLVVLVSTAVVVSAELTGTEQAQFTGKGVRRPAWFASTDDNFFCFFFFHFLFL